MRYKVENETLVPMKIPDSRHRVRYREMDVDVPRLADGFHAIYGSLLDHTFRLNRFEDIPDCREC